LFCRSCSPRSARPGGRDRRADPVADPASPLSTLRPWDLRAA
jgi:hypothetical protein